jgi:hypothetical protein
MGQFTEISATLFMGQIENPFMGLRNLGFIKDESG